MSQLDLGTPTPPPKLEMTEADVEGLNDAFESYFAAFSSLFRRSEQAKWARKYLQGLLLPLPRKSIQAIALAVEGGNIRNMQQMLGAGRWDDRALLQQHWTHVQEHLAHPEGVLIVDASGFPKKGEHSVGVARQWCGNTGKIDNCQLGVFVAYAADAGATLLDRRLYMPKRWFGDDYQARRTKNEVPETLEPQTQSELAIEMLNDLANSGLSARWVTADEDYGKSPTFLDGVAQLGLWYFAEISKTTPFWLERPATEVRAWSGRGRPTSRTYLCEGEPKPRPIAEIVAEWGAERFETLRFKEGSQGPQVAEFARVRAVPSRSGLPGPEVWVVVKRSLSGEVKYFVSNAPVWVRLATMACVSGLRWPIETCFEECKQLLGMSDYEARTWRGWHHHMTLCIVGHGFLVLNQAQKGALG